MSLEPWHVVSSCPKPVPKEKAKPKPVPKQKAKPKPVRILHRLFVERELPRLGAPSEHDLFGMSREPGHVV